MHAAIGTGTIHLNAEEWENVARKMMILAGKFERALKRVDDQMIGNEVYECAWVNYPETPEKSPSSYVREILSENAIGHAPGVKGTANE